MSHQFLRSSFLCTSSKGWSRDISNGNFLIRRPLFMALSVCNLRYILGTCAKQLSCTRKLIQEEETTENLSNNKLLFVFFSPAFFWYFYCWSRSVWLLRACQVGIKLLHIILKGERQYGWLCQVAWLMFGRCIIQYHSNYFLLLQQELKERCAHGWNWDVNTGISSNLLVFDCF